MHTCRKWRRIAFASREALRLRLFCTNGTPVKRTLHYWPALPIVVEYGGLPTLDPPAPEDEDNIITALKLPDRVISISLTITSSLMERLSAVETPFAELQDLVLLSRDGVLLPVRLLSAFRCGQSLRRLHTTGIAFPALLKPPYSTSSPNLIDLQLHDAFIPWQFSPVILKNALSVMLQLQSLSLHVRHHIAKYHSPLPPDRECVVLPVLARFKFRGSIKYLKGIFAILDAPALEDIEITFDHPFLAFPKFKKFIDWIEMHRSHCRGAHILSSEPTVLISPQNRPGSFMHLNLQSLSKPSLMQISSMAQICLNISPFLRNYGGYIHVSTTRPSGRMDSSRREELLDLLNPSTDEKSFHLDANHWIDVIVHTSQQSRYENVLFAIDKIYLPQPGPGHALLREWVVSEMVSRRLSGHPIEVEYELLCDMNEQRELGIVDGRCKTITC